MVAIDVGRVCMKLKGRDAGKRCIITEIIDKNYVMIKSAGRKKVRRCSIRHIDPLPITVDPRNAEEVERVLQEK